MFANTKHTDVEYTRHAEERMQLRAITKEMVLKTIRNPDRTYIEDDGERAGHQASRLPTEGCPF